MSYEIFDATPPGTEITTEIECNCGAHYRLVVATRWTPRYEVFECVECGETFGELRVDRVIECVEIDPVERHLSVEMISKRIFENVNHIHSKLELASWTV